MEKPIVLKPLTKKENDYELRPTSIKFIPIYVCHER